MTNCRSSHEAARWLVFHLSFLICHFSANSPVVRKNRSAGVSPASEPRQLLLGQHDLCRLEAGDTFFLTTAENAEGPSRKKILSKQQRIFRLVVQTHFYQCSSVFICGFVHAFAKK